MTFDISAEYSVEAHYMGVEIDPLVHGVPAYVAHHVVYMLETGGAGHGVRGFGAEAGEERAVVVAALDEGVDGVTIGGDRGGGDAAKLIGCLHGSCHRPRATGCGFQPGLACIVDCERNDADAIAVVGDVIGYGTAGPQGGGQHKAYFALLDNVRCAIALAGLGAGVGHQAHAESGAIIIGRLARVAYVELNVIGTLEGQKILSGLDHTWGIGSHRNLRVECEGSGIRGDPNHI
jgi:hypothetical protein